MYTVYLKNNKSYSCQENATILEAAQQNKIILEHSCLNARCRSCIAKVLSGSTVNKQEEFVLTNEERDANYILTCNSIPKSDISLDIEDLNEITIHPKKIFPTKINEINKFSKDVIKVSLRLPPNLLFEFNAGQYVNLIRNNIKRSYSLANNNPIKLEFFIKNYNGGEMSNYWFHEANKDDLVRVEGPLGTFFIRESNSENIVFLATGTGVAPIKSILDNLNNNPNKVRNKKIWVFNGARCKDDLFWQPDYKNLEINYVQVLSREESVVDGFKGYVQDAVLSKKIDLKKSQVYACGSKNMIESAKVLFLKNNLKENQFFSDEFVQSN